MCKLIVLFSLFFVSSNFAAGLKKVLVLDFINIDKDPGYNYLEGTLTDAVKQDLRKRFAFKETPEGKWKAVAEKNFIYRQDYYTQTAAINLGLLARQDVVIAGGYRVRGKKKPKLRLQVLLLDISQKRVIAQFEEKARIDNNIFTTIEEVAKRISDEAKAVLPSKEEWAKSGLKDENPSAPIFSKISVGLRAGVGLYMNSGWGSEYFQPELPVLGFSLESHVPILWERLVVSIEAFSFKHSLRQKKDSKWKIQTLDAVGLTSNYLVGMSFGVEFPVKEKFAITPLVGSGYVMQSTTITGSNLNYSFNNGFLFFWGGFNFSYDLNQFVDLILAYKLNMEIEKQVLTYLNLVSLGVNFKF